MYSEGKLPWESDLTIWINIITIRALSIPTQTPFSIYQHFLRSPFVKTRLYEKIFFSVDPFLRFGIRQRMIEFTSFSTVYNIQQQWKSENDFGDII